MRRVTWMSAIVAVLLTAGCGQRGALYLPVVPPLPEAPGTRTVPPANLQLDESVSAPASASSAASAH
jgi:predicted small lipoprotein YifL